MANNLFVFAEIIPKPEYLEEARAAILNVVERTRGEAGCRQFKVFAGLQPGTIYLYEEWDDQKALDTHYAKPYIEPVFVKYQEWLEKPPQITKMSALG